MSDDTVKIHTVQRAEETGVLSPHDLRIGLVRHLEDNGEIAEQQVIAIMLTPNGKQISMTEDTASAVLENWDEVVEVMQVLAELATVAFGKKQEKPALPPPPPTRTSFN